MSKMEAAVDASPLPERELVGLHALSREVPNIDAAVAQIARYSAELTLPQGTIHVLSDIHEDQKLRHVINNASGTLRPLVERLFKEHLTPQHFQELLTLIFYPAEVVERLEHVLRTYGDHGFTLVLEPLRTFIATHHHFESVLAAVERGADIVPSRTIVREWDEPRRIADSQRGRQLGFAIERLEQLIEAYRNHDLPQRFSSHVKFSYGRNVPNFVRNVRNGVEDIGAEAM